MTDPIPAAKTISVALVEDDPLTRGRLSASIADDPRLELAGASGSLSEARELLRAGMPRVLLVDLGLPDGDGTELITEVTTTDPSPDVMVISVFGDERHVIRAVEAGAAGYLLKDTMGRGIGDAVLELVNGGSPISPAIARHILRRFQPQPAAPSAAAQEVGLTDRQREVLVMVSRGYTNVEIADLLEISYHTVTAHVKNIYRKLSVGSRSEAVFEAQQLGILDRDRR